MKNLFLVFHILLIFSIVGCADKGVYVGEKKDGQPHGQGTYTYPDGKTFVGEYKDGDFHGGTATFLMEESMKENGRIGDIMVKEQKLSLMEVSM